MLQYWPQSMQRNPSCPYNKSWAAYTSLCCHANCDTCLLLSVWSVAYKTDSLLNSEFSLFCCLIVDIFLHPNDIAGSESGESRSWHIWGPRKLIGWMNDKATMGNKRGSKNWVKRKREGWDFFLIMLDFWQTYSKAREGHLLLLNQLEKTVKTLFHRWSYSNFPVSYKLQLAHGVVEFRQRLQRTLKVIGVWTSFY